MNSPPNVAAPIAVASGKPQGKGASSGSCRSGARKAQEPVSREAQRMATAILEVLAGVRTPTSAASALGINVPRYYVWEQRALAGLVAACEPHSPGSTSPRWRIAMLEKEVQRLQQQCARQEALARAAQRTLGLAPLSAAKPAAKAAKPAEGRPGGRKPRKRRPAVRALKAVAALRAAPTAEELASCSGAVSPEVLQPSPASTPASSDATAATDPSG
jgi:hypothetical protein